MCHFMLHAVLLLHLCVSHFYICRFSLQLPSGVGICFFFFPHCSIDIFTLMFYRYLKSKMFKTKLSVVLHFNSVFSISLNPHLVHLNTKMLELIFDWCLFVCPFVCLVGWLLLFFPLEWTCWLLLQYLFQSPFSPFHFLFQQLWIVMIVLKRPYWYLPQWFLTSTLGLLKLQLQPTASVVCRLFFTCVESVDNFFPVAFLSTHFVIMQLSLLISVLTPHCTLGFLSTKCFPRM